jgi:hypothetical protein
MIVAFIGTLDDESETPISGTGKTAGMTGYAYLDYLKGNKIYTNYYTDFSHETIGFQEMINKVKGVFSPNVKLCVSEMQNVLNSIGSTNEQVLFIDSFASQLRKIDVDIYYDTQRFMNIHKRLRVHTDVILIPFKTHMDNKACYYNNCKKPHKIYIYSQKPYKEKPIKCFNASNVGKKYETYEIIYDVLDIPKISKQSKKEQTKNEAGFPFAFVRH